MMSRADYDLGKFDTPFVEYGCETVFENGDYARKQTAKEVFPHEKFEGFKTSDFSINHLQAVGAIDMLKDCGSNYGAVGMNEIDKIGAQLNVEE